MNQARNITIGLIDGITIPFALAAGLSSLQMSSRTIFISCLAVAVAGAFTMTIGAYRSAQQPNASGRWVDALTIGASYAAGGMISVSCFALAGSPLVAFRCAVMITLTALFIAGYFDSRMNGANGWAGAVRVALTGAAAGAAAFAVAVLFR